MLIKACNAITKISDEAEVNTENYMEGITYISSLYDFLNSLKLIIPLKKITFLPSFKGKYTVEKLGIAATEKENQMKVFKVESSLFLEDKVIQDIIRNMAGICQDITQQNDILTFYLF